MWSMNYELLHMILIQWPITSFLILVTYELCNMTCELITCDLWLVNCSTIVDVTHIIDVASNVQSTSTTCNVPPPFLPSVPQPTTLQKASSTIHHHHLYHSPPPPLAPQPTTNSWTTTTISTSNPKSTSLRHLPQPHHHHHSAIKHTTNYSYSKLDLHLYSLLGKNVLV